jgi:hypothetical protein
MKSAVPSVRRELDPRSFRAVERLRCEANPYLTIVSVEISPFSFFNLALWGPGDLRRSGRTCHK